MFWKLVKYELQSVHKWYLGIYGIAILLSIPFGFNAEKIIFALNTVTSQSLFIAFFALISFATIIVWGAIYIATIVILPDLLQKYVFGREGYLTNTLPVSAN